MNKFYFQTANLLLAVFFIVFAPAALYAQGVVISKGNDVKEEPHSSAILDLRSNEKGILIPRMSTDDRNNIANPANGLLVFDENENAFFYYDANAKDGKGVWVAAMSDSVIGTGEPGSVAFWETESTIGASPFMLVNEENFVQVTSKAPAGDDDPIFEVRNRDGHVVLGVYQTGVRILVDDSPDKTSRGGFAIGGFTTGKDKQPIDYLKVTPDSVRVYVMSQPEGKDGEKTSRGGFAIGGFTTGKGLQELFKVTPESTRVYIDDRPGKTSRGGFAIGGFTTGKDGLAQDFFNVETLSNEEIVISPSEARVLWYPLKNAFLAGQVLVENPADVGFNSLSIGYETKASGNRSQALGFQSIATGDYSTAIGRSAQAQNTNSFAFGDNANAIGKDAFAFGSSSMAQGNGSYAFGSLGRDSVNNVLEDSQTIASGNNAFAFGLGAVAGGDGSFALGSNVYATGPNSVAMGFGTLAQQQGSYAMGWGAKAIGGLSFSSGFYTSSEGEFSIALGYISKATNMYSVAMGHLPVSEGLAAFALGTSVRAKSLSEFVVGAYNQIEGYNPNNNLWIPTDRLFVIGNGVEGMRSNALTVLKNGYIGLQDVVSPTYSLQLPNNVMPGEYGRAMATEWITYSDKRIKSKQEKMSYGLIEVLKLTPLEYFHHSSINSKGVLVINNEGASSIGLIAQDVYEIIPEVVSKPEDDENELWGMSYEKLIPVLIKAIQEQQEIINQQKNEIHLLKASYNKIERLENELNNIRKMLED